MERTRTSRRALVAASVATLLAGPLLAGCSAGFDATSRQPYSPSDGINATSGDLRVLNALVVKAEDGSDGLISAGLVNNGDRDDRLTEITSPAGAVSVSGSKTLPAGESVTLGSGTQAQATVSGLTKEPGETITLRLAFGRTAPVTIRTVVVAATGDYADLAPAPAPEFTSSP